MTKAPDCQFCGAHAYGKMKDTYHTSCGTYHMVADGRTLRSPECKHSQLRQVVREAVKRLEVLLDDLREAVGDERDAKGVRWQMQSVWPVLWTQAFVSPSTGTQVYRVAD